MFIELEVEPNMVTVACRLWRPDSWQHHSRQPAGDVSVESGASWLHLDASPGTTLPTGWVSAGRPLPGPTWTQQDLYVRDDSLRLPAGQSVQTWDHSPPKHSKDIFIEKSTCFSYYVNGLHNIVDSILSTQFSVHLTIEVVMLRNCLRTFQW